MLELLSKNKKIRKGKITTKSGEIITPFFMPDATRGFVKSLGAENLKHAGAGPMVVNTYHLYLQPGTDIIKKAGGINKFMSWEYPLLSDSGGYQIFSLIHKNSNMGKITDEEAVFRSPLDGSSHKISPEKSIRIQFDLGVDMMVCLDDPPPNTDSREKIEKAVDRTISWAKRCMLEYKKQLKIREITERERPLIFCVVQGGEYLDLRKKCIDGLIEIGFSDEGGSAVSWDGYGFGARHVDKDGNFLGEVLEYTADLIPENSLRFALGVGYPEDIVRCARMGWDMFDCVIPTREARHGRIFLWKRDFDLANDGFYETINITNSRFKEDFIPVDLNCDCEMCKGYSRAYMHHIFKSKDPLSMRLASIHNLKFYSELMKKVKNL